MKLYGYKGCGTCKKANKWLAEHGIELEEIPIRDRPPSLAELKKMLVYMEGDLKKLFNTSGGDYRALGISEKLPKLSEKQALELLASNGNLVKRPFVLTPKGGTVGFKPEVWAELFGKRNRN